MGCKASKDIKEPPSKKPDENGTPIKERPKIVIRHRSPEKKKRALRELSDQEMQQFRLVDIFKFVKEGNLQMVHSFVKYFGLVHVAPIIGFEETVSTQGNSYDLADWNPLLVAIAFKQAEIVDYFATQMRISLKQAGTYPRGSTKIEDEIFCLKMALKFDSYECFGALWAVFEAWDLPHFQEMLQICVENEDAVGLNALLDSYTADVIFSSLSFEHKTKVIRSFYELVKDASDDFC